MPEFTHAVRTNPLALLRTEKPLPMTYLGAAYEAIKRSPAPFARVDIPVRGEGTARRLAEIIGHEAEVVPLSDDATESSGDHKAS